MTLLNWKISASDAELVSEIVKRARMLHPMLRSMQSLSMDITACHLNGCPIDLSELLTAENLDFSHDVLGIVRHMDRSTGQLTECFVPRFAIRSTTPEVIL